MERVTFIFITIFQLFSNNSTTNKTTAVEKNIFFFVEVFLPPIDSYDLLLSLILFQYLLFLSSETYWVTTTNGALKLFHCIGEHPWCIKERNDRKEEKHRQKRIEMIWYQVQEHQNSDTMKVDEFSLIWSSYLRGYVQPYEK